MAGGGGLRALRVDDIAVRAAIRLSDVCTLRKALPLLRWAGRRATLHEAIPAWATRALGLQAEALHEWGERAAFGALAARGITRRARSGRIAELSSLLCDPDLAPAARCLEEGRGLLLAGAHLGPPAAVRQFLRRAHWPDLLSLTLLENRWDDRSLAIAEEPARQRSLISALLHLRAGGTVYTALDEPNGAAIDLELFGTPIRVGRGLAALARLSRAPAMPVAALWDGSRIHLTMGAPLPRPECREEREWEWERRWLEAYLAWFEELARGPAENLRLDGGLWRQGPRGLL